jgi:ABC-2 type transport system permease protein
MASQTTLTSEWAAAGVGRRPSFAAIGRGSMGHYLRALRAIIAREITKFVHQLGRLTSAIVRPALWLIVFAAGFQKVLGVSIVPPYQTYITYQEYMVPGLIAMVLLFNGMQSSLSLVYDREVGIMRLLLTAPLPRWYLLLCKVVAGTILSIFQAYAFLLVATLSMQNWGRIATNGFAAFAPAIPWEGLIWLLPVMFFAGMMLGAIGLLLSVYIRQLENFAGTMNFVIFPMFFLSTSLYPLWKLKESGAEYLYWIAMFNPFTYATEMIRFACYSKWAGLPDTTLILPSGLHNHYRGFALAVVIAVTLVCFFFAVMGYDPQRGLIRRRQQASA